MTFNAHLRKPMNDLPQDAVIWMAGFFDGEGCVSLTWRRHVSQNRPWFVVSATIVNTDLDVLRWFKDVTGIGCYYERKKHENRQQTAEWIVTHYGAEQFLRAIAPFSRTKKRQIDLALEARSLIQRAPFEQILDGDFNRLVEIWHEMSSAKGRTGSRVPAPPTFNTRAA